MWGGGWGERVDLNYLFLVQGWKGSQDTETNDAVTPPLHSYLFSVSPFLYPTPPLPWRGVHPMPAAQTLGLVQISKPAVEMLRSRESQPPSDPGFHITTGAVFLHPQTNERI